MQEYEGGVDDLVTLFRPTGPKELALVAASGWKRWPPRLPEQPIFYPVTNDAYARGIAERWNVKESGAGFVTRFAVKKRYLDRYERQVVSAREHEEFWIPAEDLEAMNDAIVGEIEVIASFGPDADAPALAVLSAARGRLDPIGLAGVVQRLAPGGLLQSTLVTFFKRAFSDIPLRTLLGAGAWHRVSGGGMTDAEFVDLLAPWLRIQAADTKPGHDGIRAVTPELPNAVVEQWAEYLQAEASSQRAVFLPALTRFIETLRAEPESDWHSWAMKLAAAVSDDGAVVPVRFTLFRDVLLPALSEGVLSSEPGCARWLASFASMFAKAPPSRLPEHLRTPIGLLEEAVRLDPSDVVARSRLVQLLANYLRYTLHELPAGVLYGSDGATLPQCDELKETLDEFEAHLRPSGQAAEYAALVDACRFHFQAYAEYLRSTPRPRSYHTYLRDIGAGTLAELPPTGARRARTPGSDSNS